MKDETKPDREFAFGKRFRALENQVAELREYLQLPPATDTDEPDRSTLFVIVDASEREEPKPYEAVFLGSVLHATTDPRVAHELFQMESVRAPEQIGMYAYRHLDVAELQSCDEPADPLAATVYVYLSKDTEHKLITMKAPHHERPSPGKNEIAFGES